MNSKIILYINNKKKTDKIENNNKKIDDMTFLELYNKSTEYHRTKRFTTIYHYYVIINYHPSISGYRGPKEKIICREDFYDQVKDHTLSHIPGLSATISIEPDFDIRELSLQKIKLNYLNQPYEDINIRFS